MTTKPMNGIVAVMLTPFKDDGTVDYDSLARLIDWYIANGVDVLFAVCQSSEVLFLSLDERVALSRFVVKHAAGRVPVVSSGHIGQTRDEQLTELTAIAATGPDALILITNRLDPDNLGETAFRQNLDWLLQRLPDDLPLGLYECPAPFRRLLSDEELAYCAGTGRFVIFKDVCCDLKTVERRVHIAEGTPLAIVNANGTIALEAMKVGSKGYSGVFNNIHPDLYAWMYRSWRKHPALAEELSAFLAVASVSELMGYPAIAKLYQQKLGTIETIKCRAIDYDIRERFWWGGEPILDKIMIASEHYSKVIASL
ncbi:dihydrodipicolinate synthase family protein [Telmatospirillum sp.]|uniref:dihydrodipicolinate synthase family protein n=1 Tax=Telmatospirillum sp. TaxID=2079197 RepID=UPI002850BE82|nr:dihydrodipicolinate synthase family protein [Telmatospirillum sp.]MDR3436937.1 dihydrodipicolinate synthase family protein [Telmatospirillum sp.]